MPHAVTCNSCATRMKIPDNGLGKRVKCPRCANVFVAEDDDAPVEAELDTDIAEEPIAVSKRRRIVEEEEAPRPSASRKARRAADDEIDEVEEVEEAEEEDEDRPRKKKKKKKRRRQTVATTADEGPPAWPWWVFGGGGVALVMLFLLFLAIFTKTDSPVKWIAAYLLISMPISTVMFFLVMLLGSVLFGAMEIGEIHVAFIKAFGLLFVVNLLNMIPLAGMYLAPFVMLVGLIVVFKLDIWESYMLIMLNVAMNLVVTIFVWFALFSLLAGGYYGSGYDDDFSPRRRQPVPNQQGVPGQQWNEDDFDN